MTQENVMRRNQLMEQLKNGIRLNAEDSLWLQNNPIYSVRYGAPYVTADMIAVEPGKETVLTVQCIRDDREHPIVPTFTIPFEKDGFVKLSSVVSVGGDFRNMRQSTKLSLRMISGVTVTLRCRSESGLVMVSYQGWVPDNKPIPMWFETTRCPRFAMRKTIHSENMISYGCCGAEATVEPEAMDAHFTRFEFLLNWYSL